MNITKTELTGALSALGKLICRTSPLAEYKCLQIETTPQAVFLRTASLNEVLEYRIHAEVDQIIDLCLDFDEFRDAVRNCRNKSLLLEYQEDDETLLVGERKLAVKLIRLPVIERAEQRDSVVLTEGFLDMCRSLASVIDRHEYRKILHGIHVSRDGLVATNGRELLHIPLSLEMKETCFTIPLPLGLMMRKETEAGVLEWWQDSGVTYVRISIGKWTWITKSLQGDYPNWKQVIPDRSVLCNTIQYSPETCNELLQWCKNLPESKDDVTPVSLSITENGNVHLTACSMELDVPAETTGDWKTLTIHLNKCAFQRALFLGHTTFRFHDAYSPMTADGGMGEYVAMPVRKVKTNQTITNDKEKEPMNVTTTEPVTEPVQETEEITLSPMDELMNAIESCRLKLKAANDEAINLSRKVREVQLAQKQKERDFILAKRAIERIRMAI